MVKVFLLILLACYIGLGSIKALAKSKKCLKQICEGNTQNVLRGSDPQGSGYYGARRGKRTHKGVDIKCNPGSSVYAPFETYIVGVSRPYGNGKNYDDGLKLKGQGTWKGFQAKIWYLKGISTRENVEGGKKIGTSLKLPYSKITQHVHLELRKDGKIVNPSDYIC